MAGRATELDAFDVLLSRLERGATEQSMIVTGLRGVGKTVLLGEFRRRSEARDWVTIEAEMTKATEFGPQVGALARRALLSISSSARWGDRAKRAARVIKSFSITIKPDGSLNAGLDVGPAEGLADSGDFANDLTDLFVALGEAAQEHQTGVVFLFDEIQFLGQAHLEALITALHKTVQRNLPVTLVAAGLPQIPRLAGEAKSYSERLFKFPEIGQLEDDEARAALVGPAQELGVGYADDATEAIVTYTDRYPYFLQEYGKIVWDEAYEPPITLEDVTRAQPVVEQKLDGSFFRVRADRTTELELAYLRAMAGLGPGPQKALDVARVLRRTSEQLAPTRSRLIEKGLLYTPGYGLAAFTVPQFDRYMVRNHPLVVPEVKRRSRK